MSAEKLEKIFWAALVLWFLLRLVLMMSELRGDTSPQTKLEVLKYFSLADIKAGKAYALWGFWFKLIYGFVYVAMLVALLKLGYFAAFWHKCESWVGRGFFKQNLLFSFSFFVFLRLVLLPSSFYLGFLKETFSGFCSVSFSGWLLLYLKSALLESLLETIGATIVFGAVYLFSNLWHIAIPLLIGIFALAVMILSPLIITPLFYTQTPLPEGALRVKLLSVASKANMKVKEIYVINESRYSKHTNAYFTGIGPYKRIVLYDNLIKNSTPDETVLVFAHEAGHWRHNHVAWGMAIGFLVMFLISFLCKLVLPHLACVKWFLLSDLSSSLCLPFAMIIFIILNLIFSPIEAQISQFMEKQADKASIELTGLNKAFIEAQIKLAKNNCSDLMPPPLRVFWLYSHPTAIQRIKSAEN